MLEHQENNKTQLSPVAQLCLTLCDPMNCRKFTVHVLLKPGLENFEHYFTSV